MTFSLEFTPTPESVRDVERHAAILARITRPDPEVTTDVAFRILDGFADAFANEATGFGVPWDRLAPMTVEERIFEGYGGEHPILQRTGEYMRSWVYQDDSNHVSRVEYDGLGWRVTEGSSHPYAATHEEGGVTDTGHAVPPRPVSELGEATTRRIEEAIHDWLLRRLP